MVFGLRCACCKEYKEHWEFRRYQNPQFPEKWRGLHYCAHCFHRFYTSTPEWEERALATKERANWRCEHCKRDYVPLDAHHKTYVRLGFEWPEDLEALCRSCHDVADLMREVAEERARWEKRVRAWAEKVLGNYWKSDYDFTDAEERFISWMTRTGRPL